MNTAIVGLGSNIRPQENIRKARELLAQKYQILAESRFVITQAIGKPQAPDFLNGALLLETESDCEDFKLQMKALERELGRTSRQTGGEPRVIDLDLLVWNSQVMDEDVRQRPFVQDSVRELLPELPL